MAFDFSFGSGGGESSTKKAMAEAQSQGADGLPVAQQQVAEALRVTAAARQQAHAAYSGSQSLLAQSGLAHATPELSAALGKLQQLAQAAVDLDTAAQHLAEFPQEWVTKAVSPQVHGNWAFGSAVNSSNLLPWNKWQIYSALAADLSSLAAQSAQVNDQADELREAFVAAVQQAQVGHEQAAKQAEYAAQDQSVVDELARARQQLERDRALRADFDAQEASFAQQNLQLSDETFRQTLAIQQQTAALEHAQRMEAIEEQRKQLEERRSMPLGTNTRLAQVAPQQEEQKSSGGLLAAAAALLAWRFL